MDYVIWPASYSGKVLSVVRRFKRAEKAIAKPKVMMGDQELKCVFTTTYLGHRFQGDGCSMQAIEVRMAIAANAYTKLQHIWKSNELSDRLKLQLYASGVISVLTHCHEVWKLTTDALRMLRGWNARRLSNITGRSIRDETVSPTLDLGLVLRKRRLRWLGHILRMDDTRLVRRVVMSIVKPYPEGSIMMDAPQHDSIEELVEMAGGHGYENHHAWSKLVDDLQ